MHLGEDVEYADTILAVWLVVVVVAVVVGGGGGGANHSKGRTILTNVDEDEPRI